MQGSPQAVDMPLRTTCYLLSGYLIDSRASVVKLVVARRAVMLSPGCCITVQ